MKPIVTSQASAIPVVASGKVGETSEPEWPVEIRGTVFFCNPSSQTAPKFTGAIITSRQQSTLSVNAPLFMPTIDQVGTSQPGEFNISRHCTYQQRPKKIIFRNGNYPNTAATLFFGISDSAS